MNSTHTPVMLEKSLALLNLRPGAVWVDATAGGGGHLREIIRRTGSGTIVGIDRDPAAIAALSKELGAPARLVHANYSEIRSVLAQAGVDAVTGGIVADLGVSSRQLADASRGFSFMHDGPLDMRMDPTSTLTADTLVNTVPEGELADLIFKYGEERASRKIARKIVASRPIKSTRELADLVASCVKSGKGELRERIHPATRTFQALRIAVNSELDSLEKFLREAPKVMTPGARLVVITFHSLEDRLVKQIFRELSSSCVCPPRQPICTCGKKPELLIITRKPLTPDANEVLANPRSRSAKLRAGEKVA